MHHCYLDLIELTRCHSNYYIILLAFGMALKVVGGLFAFFLHRSLRGNPIIPGTSWLSFKQRRTA